VSVAALSGVKVVEFAHVIAGPLAGTLMADLGAEVVHVEDPEVGDPGRQQGPAKNGVHLWWKVSARNKRSVTLNLRTPDGQAVARQLVEWADVVITNFRIDTLRKWGLDWNAIHALNPRAVMLQITGNGATATDYNAPGFGKVGEARSGVVHITGFPDGPPIHTGFSHADTTTALMGAYAVTAALVRRHEPDFDGEWIDLALNETLFRLIEWQIIFYDQFGASPDRAGNQMAVAPGAVVNTYLTADNTWITVTSATPRSVRNIAELLGEPLTNYETTTQQAQHKDRLDQLLTTWIARRTADECLSAMTALEVVASRIYNAEDITNDITYAERDNIITITDPDLGPVRMQNVIPKLRQHPTAIWRTGPALGQDNALVYHHWLGIPTHRLTQLHEQGTI